MKTRFSHDGGLSSGGEGSGSCPASPSASRNGRSRFCDLGPDLGARVIDSSVGKCDGGSSINSHRVAEDDRGGYIGGGYSSPQSSLNGGIPRFSLNERVEVLGPAVAGRDSNSLEQGSGIYDGDFISMASGSLSRSFVRTASPGRSCLKKSSDGSKVDRGGMFWD